MADQKRDFDVIVFGAGGVTGRQVCVYLDERGARWAAAGRDPEKVGRTLAELDVTAPETVVADVSDPASLRGMAARTAVVLDLVGPYSRFGEPVIEACVEAGAHYADLTGEIPFARRTIARHHDRAVSAGVKIVEVCGFEALPPDLGTLLAVESLRERFGSPANEVSATVSVEPPPGVPRPSDWISGGTFQSMAEIVGSEEGELVADPAALVLDPAAAGAIRARSPIELRPRREGNQVIGPMAPAAFINPPVIHRTAAELAAEVGEALVPFAYREGIEIDGPAWTLPLRLGAAGALAATQAGLRTAAKARPEIRRRAAAGLRSVLPSSGFGPAGDRLVAWSWSFRIVASGGGGSVEVTVDGDGHPGYLTTARMLGEAGLLMAEPDTTPKRAGCLTPALALGIGTLERFEPAGLRFRVS